MVCNRLILKGSAAFICLPHWNRAALRLTQMVLSPKR
jgi:hypothetical protein